MNSRNLAVLIEMAGDGLLLVAGAIRLGGIFV